MTRVMLVLGIGGLLVAFLTAGCAPGADGLRQACATTNTILADSYRSVTAAMATDLGQARATHDATAETKLRARVPLFGKALATLDVASAAKTAACAYADTSTDTKGLIAKVLAIAANVQKAVVDLLGVL